MPHALADGLMLVFQHPVKGQLCLFAQFFKNDMARAANRILYFGTHLPSQ
jgi:hypothetical protein